MKLTEKQQEQIINKFTELWTDKTCEICSNKDWNIDDTIFEMREFHGATTILGKGMLKPLLIVSCTKCSNTKFFNAINLDLIDGVKN